MSVQHDFDGFRHFEPQFSRNQGRGHLGRSNPGAEVARASVGGGVAVRGGGDIARPCIPLLMHDAVADAFSDMELFNAVFLCQGDTCVIVRIVVFSHCCWHTVVKDNSHLIRVVDTSSSHFLQRVQKIRSVNVMNHKHIGMGNHNITWLHMVQPRIFLKKLFHQGVACFAPPHIIQLRVPRLGDTSGNPHLGILNQSAVLHNSQKVLRHLSHRKLLSVDADAFPHFHGNHIPALTEILDTIALD